MRAEHPGAAAAALLGVFGMWGGVRAQEEFAAPRGGRLHQRLTVAFAFEDGQAVEMRLQPAREHVSSVEEQVLGRDSASDVGLALDVLHRVGGGGVLEHHSERRQLSLQRRQLFLQEHFFAVKDVHVRVHHFAVHQQRQPELGHGLERVPARSQVAHPRSGVGGGSRRVQLQPSNHAAGRRRLHHFRCRGFGQVQGHQRLEFHTFWNCGHDLLAIRKSH
mmetsp:Transcript_44194/g.84484  ORF Transcript_44194/g.84484 Transcript_44194/m.84484 type:complete len:219 (+) Transcript_44194:493-1149(+)